MSKINILIPFESSIKFENNIKEICSISLEHEITKNEGEILGNFFITGTYKEHELSVNTHNFNYTLPFSVDINEDIEMETIEFSIDNFTYDIIDNTMTVKIDYAVKADKKETREEIINEEVIPEEIIPEIERDNVNVDIVTNNLNLLEDDFEKFHVHIIKENDSLDSLSVLYKCSKDEILEINKIDKLEINQKILVLEHNE